MFPYVLGAIGLAVVVVLFMIITGIGRDRLPFSEVFAVHAPTAADGSEALSLMTLTHEVGADEKSLAVEGTVVNLTEKKIAGLVAEIVVNDKFSLPAQTQKVPVEPADLAPKATGMFRANFTLGETGLGSYSVQFRLPNDGPYVPHKDEHPLVIPAASEQKPVH
jgi:hypothetical protein